MQSWVDFVVPAKLFVTSATGMNPDPVFLLGYDCCLISSICQHGNSTTKRLLVGCVSYVHPRPTAMKNVIRDDKM